jgi:hypothetical protein
LSFSVSTEISQRETFILFIDQEEGAQSTPGPGALLVEVEDVTEDCAAVVDIPVVEPQAPIYSIAPAELRQTIQ